MPYQSPGALQDQEYWELTAFPTRAHGERLAGQVLDAGSAASVDLHAPLPASMHWWMIVVGVALVLVLVGFALRWRCGRRRAS